MHSSGGERFEEEQLTQLGGAERRVRSSGLTEKRLLMGKQGMARGVEDRRLIAVIMSMLLNSFLTRSSSIVASERHCSPMHPMSTGFSMGRLSKSHAHGPHHLPALPNPVRGRGMKAWVCVEIGTRRKGKSSRTER
jgi:hypothetical protein